MYSQQLQTSVLVSWRGENLWSKRKNKLARRTFDDLACRMSSWTDTEFKSQEQPWPLIPLLWRYGFVWKQGIPKSTGFHWFIIIFHVFLSSNCNLMCIRYTPFSRLKLPKQWRLLPRYKPAIKFGKTAFERFGELGCQLGQGMVKDAMGRVYIVMDKPDKAFRGHKVQGCPRWIIHVY